MTLEDYRYYRYYCSASRLDYEFDSEGPKGRIRKVVSYSPQYAGGIRYFNLGFGDLNKATGKIDDLAITDNQDREKVLATVAATLLEFIRQFPDATVYATGSTPARTRLYQMGIAANWTEIAALLYVYGYEQNTGWQPFQKNVPYVAF